MAPNIFCKRFYAVGREGKMEVSKFFALLMLFCCFLSLGAQTVLNPGDIAIIGVNCDNPDDFAFLTTVDVPAGTEIRFTDKGVDSSGGLRKYEGILKYVAHEDLVAGTIVVYRKDSADFIEEGAFALSTDGDQLIVYQETDTGRVFIYGVNIEGDAVWQNDATSANTSALPPGLENGYTAVALREYNNVKYNGETNFPSRDAALNAIGNKDNWVGSNSTRYDLSSFNDFSLPVIISAISGEFQSGVVRLFWKTEAELGLVGFNIYRASGEDSGKFLRINEKLIEARGRGTVGAKYTYTDSEVTQGGKYRYKIGAVDLNGLEIESSPIEVSTETCVLQENFHIESIYPNPTNGQFVVFLSVQKSKKLEIALYDCLGRKVRSIPSRLFQKGHHTIVFPIGGNLPSGIYFCRVSGSGGYVRTKKVIYIK